MPKAAATGKAPVLRTDAPPGKESPAFPWWWLLALVLLIEGVLDLYGPALKGPFVFDDFSLPFYDPHRVVDDVTQWVRGVRPVLMFSYWLNYHFAGRDPYSYHVLNVLIHLGNGVLVFAIASKLLRSRTSGAAVAALFLIHPVQTESVAYVAGRSESLSAFFLLAAYALFVFAPASGAGWARSLGILALFALGAGTKEHAVVLAAVLLLTDWLLHAGHFRRNLKLYGMLAVAGLIAAGFVWKVLSTSQSAGFRIPGVTWYGYFFTQLAVLPTYLRLTVIPTFQTLDYNVPILTLPNGMSLAGLSAIAGLLYLAWKFRRQRPLITYGILLFFVFLAPTSSIIPIKDPIAERRLYLPLFGLLVAGAAALPRAYAKWTIGLAGIAFCILTYQRNQLWGSESRLWEDALAKDPLNARAYPHLVHGYVSEGRCQEALNRLEEASRRVKVSSELLVHWAFAYECVNRLDDAIRKLEQADADANVLMKIAVDKLRLHQDSDAMTAVNRALSMNPSFDSAYVTRGDLYARAGEIDRALQDYRRALGFNPGNQRARKMLQVLAR